jgi:ketosteroid isomerase-like protein
MNKDNAAIARAYYIAMAEKNSADVEKYLHEDVCLIGPYGKKEGKEVVFEAAKKFMYMFKDIHIQSQCSSENQVMLAYELLEFGKTTTTLRAASVITFKDGLIIKNELFFDTCSI